MCVCFGGAPYLTLKKNDPFQHVSSSSGFVKVFGMSLDWLLLLQSPYGYITIRFCFIPWRLLYSIFYNDWEFFASVIWDAYFGEDTEGSDFRVQEWSNIGGKRFSRFYLEGHVFLCFYPSIANVLKLFVFEENALSFSPYTRPLFNPKTTPPHHHRRYPHDIVIHLVGSSALSDGVMISTCCSTTPGSIFWPPRLRFVFYLLIETSRNSTKIANFADFSIF